jgi:hypothetical protein
MHTAGLGDQIIVSEIQNEAGSLQTNPDSLITLKAASISDSIIGAILAKNSNNKKPAAAPAPTYGPAVAPVQPAPPAPEPAVEDVQASARPAAPQHKQPIVFIESKSSGTNLNVDKNQSLEMAKDFGKDCPGIQISMQQALTTTLS